MSILLGTVALHNGWPQAIMLTLMVMSDLLSLRKHGQPRTVKHSFPVDLSGSVIALAILYWGGFFMAAT